MKTRIIFIIIFFLYFIFAVYYEESKDAKRNLKEISYSDYLDTTLIELENSGRGGLRLDTNFYLRWSYYIEDNNSSYSGWETHEPIISFTNNPYKLGIKDVPFPFKVYKLANSDTLVVLKDSFELKFKLIEPKK